MCNSNRHDSVCVIIVNYNSGKWLKMCLKHLKLQTFRSFHTLVVDNRSTDESISLTKKDLNRFELILNPNNIGFAGANNMALREVNTEWVALLNPDALPEPGWLASLMMAAQNNPDYHFFASRMISACAPNLLDGAGDEYHASGLVWRHGHGAIASGYLTESREVFSPCAAAALYRRSDLIEVGGFDEDFFCYVEDVDIGFRLRLAGRRCLYVPDAVVHHVGSATTGRKSDFSVYHGHRNLVWAFLKNMPVPFLAVYLPAHLFLNIFSIAWFALKGQGRVILRAKLDALKGIPRMLRKRRRIQAERQVTWKEIRRVLHRGIPRRP
jgi:GT2 family glycosyltransferase